MVIQHPPDYNFPMCNSLETLVQSKLIKLKETALYRHKSTNVHMDRKINYQNPEQSGDFFPCFHL